MKKLLFVITMIVSVSMLSCNPQDEDDDKNIDEISKATGEINGYGYVDLGLPSGTKWATCNIGALSYEDYGNYLHTVEPLTEENIPIAHLTT